MLLGLKLLVTLAAGLALSACGGGGSDNGGGGGGGTTTTFTIGGTVSGLASGASVVLQNNGANSTTVSANGVFTFSTAIATGGAYAVAVQTQPTGQTCTVANGSGTVAAAAVTNVAVTCVTNPPNTFSVGGTVSGLASGASVVLRNNGGNNLTVSANGAYTFTTAIATGGAYAVTVFTQPTNQTCTVANASGTIASANITNVNVTCVTNAPNTFTVGGTVSGLATGASVVLRNNGGNNLTVSANGAFTFSTAIVTGGAYLVTPFTQPTNPTQVCTVANGSGTVASANITNVIVTCTTSTFTVGGTVSGLATGASVVLQNSGANATMVNANGSFSFPAVASGTAYVVTVQTQPAGQTCTVSNGTGTVTSSNVTSVAIVCRSRYAFVSNEYGTPYVASYLVGANGGFTPVSALSVGTHATGVAVTPSGNHVIVAVDPDDNVQSNVQSNVHDGELRVYAVSSTGQLTLVSTSPMGAPTYSNSYCGGLTSGSISCGIGVNSAPETVLIHPNGRFVYVMDGVADGVCLDASSPCTNPAAGNRVIVRYSFDPVTGALTYQDRHYVEGFMSFAIDPQGRFLWATSYLETRIYEFRINQTTGELTFGTGTFIGMTYGNMWLGIDPNGNYAYAAHAGDLTIDAYTIDPVTGHLTNISAVPGVNDGNYNKVTGVSVWGLAVSANGRTLYGAGSGGSVIAYSLGTDGRIGATLSGSPFAPATPLNGGGYRALVGIGSAGQYLYLLGYADAAARVFAINSTSGALTETAGSPASLAPSTAGITALSLQ